MSIIDVEQAQEPPAFVVEVLVGQALDDIEERRLDLVSALAFVASSSWDEGRASSTR
jgi:hypothetical protein